MSISPWSTKRIVPQNEPAEVVPEDGDDDDDGACQAQFVGEMKQEGGSAPTVRR